MKPIPQQNLCNRICTNLLLNTQPIHARICCEASLTDPGSSFCCPKLAKLNPMTGHLWFRRGGSKRSLVKSRSDTGQRPPLSSSSPPPAPASTLPTNAWNASLASEPAASAGSDASLASSLVRRQSHPRLHAPAPCPVVALRANFLQVCRWPRRGGMLVGASGQLMLVLSHAHKFCRTARLCVTEMGALSGKGWSSVAQS